MKKSIQGRELIVLDSLDAAAIATYHKTCEDSYDSQSELINRDRVGVLILNGLSATRAGNGDAAVWWADWFAECGYPSFRLDLPGFGDSVGDPPEDWLDFINLGGYASVASAKVRELVARFNLSGVLLVGHCAGTVSAIFTAAATKECRGLILMEPYFQFRQTIRPKIRAQLSLWATRSRLGGILSSIFDRVKGIRLAFRRNVLPENANLLLLRRWKEMTSTGMPILILKAPGFKTQGAKPRVGEFDYFKYAMGLAGRRSQVVVRSVEGANHSFANHQARAAVRQHTEEWLNGYFPLRNRKEVL
ncbi:alpha/beta fold hydrolase [Alloacidobacterium dinghuense]|uniref:Alpha/beta fold hydrolase n=1 Tax=Alloacidobacterium dinghuense TaxID=2763107 RepID=A0A7G8BPK7_9BACT|nr:alpha/beta fold hydrolase [Alloacidobacterium dinghuense]QNI34477.1 alpha/beta fold hydrolase [Alloacidobacterium dinghuense]